MYKKVSDFCSDYFFHYLLHHCDWLRLEFCRYLSCDDTIRYTTIENCDTYSTHKDGGKRILDIVVKDDKNRFYNFEMQNNDIAYSDIKRFQIYAMRLIERQMIGKEKLNQLSKVRQLIIYTGRAIDNLNHYHHRMELYDKRYKVLLEKGLIIMNIIQLEKMEEEEMDVLRQDVHQVMRLFKDEEAHKEEQESGLAKEVVKIYEQFISSNDYYNYIALERDRWYFNDKIEESYESGIIQGEEKGVKKGKIVGKEEGLVEGKTIGKEEGLVEGKTIGKEEGLVEGKTIGKEEGLIEGKLSAIKVAIKEIYDIEDLDWLNQFTLNQLEKTFKLVFKGLEYEELKLKIMKVCIKD